MIDLEKLKKLVETPAAPGREEFLLRTIIDLVKDHADEYFVDPMGNLFVRKGSGKRKLLLDAHIDQIGMIVTAIEDDGRIRFAPLGGLDRRALIGQRVVFIKEGFPRGVIGHKSIHILRGKEDANRVPDIEDLRIDIGALSKEEAEKIVEIGDYATYESRLVTLPGGALSSAAMDNRISAYVLIEVLRKSSPSTETRFVFSTQEELGLRGARVAAYRIDPDIAICLDVTHSKASGTRYHEDVRLGKGTVITLGPILNRDLTKRLIKIANELKISYQFEVNDRYTGTNTDVITLTRSGVPTALISVPLRYMHTPIEVVHPNDVMNTIALVKAAVERIGELEIKPKIRKQVP